MAASSDTNSQGPIFWERLRRLFVPPTDGRGDEDEPRRGLVITTCVLISFVLWFTLSLQEPKTVTLEIPTRVVNKPADEALTDLPPEAVEMQVRGERLQLLWLYLSPPVAEVDAGRREVDVQDALTVKVAEVSDVRVESVSPRTIQVSKAPRVTRRLPVRLRANVQLPPAHELLHPPRVEPGSVSVSGASTLLASIESWPTDSVAVEVSDSLRRPVALSDTLARLVEREPGQVTMVVQAGKFADAQREIEVEVTGVPSDQDLVALEPSTIRVRYRVLFDQLFESQRAADFYASVSYSQIRSDTTGYVEPDVHVPSSLVIRDPEPMPRQLRYYTFVSGE